MRLSDRGAKLSADFEGFRSCPYRDAVGVWTIGFGSTSGVGPNTKCMSRADALKRMKREVDQTYGKAVNEAVVISLVGVSAFNYVFTAVLLATNPELQTIR